MLTISRSRRILIGSISLVFIALTGALLWSFYEPPRTQNPESGIDLFPPEEIPYDLLSDIKEEYSLNISSSFSGCEVYIPAEALCVMVEKYAEEMKCSFQGYGDYDGRLELISEALLLDEAAQTAKYGLRPKNQKQIVTPLYSLVFQCVVRKNSGIHSLADLRNKRVAVGGRFSEEEMLTREILRLHGLEYADFEPVYLDLEDATMAMEAAEIDCIAAHSALPSKLIARMSANFDILLLPLEEPGLIEDPGGALPGYEVVTIPAQTYKGMDRYILTVATEVLLAAERETKMIVTYEVIKALYDHMIECKSIFPLDREIRIDRLNEKYPVSFHQGAVKYYWEREFIWN
ncbi:MAG: TAXI family TRAP transporter solute-binding subunit [Peptococcaceae bacterium]|nr:TAXI family TRAP transporter solute-binding subunit [Peptococcaceae bacterium]